MHHAGVMHLSAPLALCDLLSQIRQPEYRLRSVQLNSVFDIDPSVRTWSTTSKQFRRGSREAVASRSCDGGVRNRYRMHGVITDNNERKYVGAPWSQSYNRPRWGSYSVDAN